MIEEDSSPSAELTDREKLIEYELCKRSALYFIINYVYIYDKRAGVQDWVKFELFPDQIKTLKTLDGNLLHIILKARQLGLTWLVLGFFLWAMLFRPKAQILLFSLREDEAIHLLDDRLKGMYKRLPEWLQARSVVKDGSKYWALSNGSSARAFSTTAGDSYAATHVLVDEADLVPHLSKLLSRNKPTIDGGGMLVLLSRADKRAPQSDFKKIYRAAAQGNNAYTPTFLPWSARPDRDGVWYDEQCRDAMANFGSLDSVWEQYPATPEEALAPATLDKRLPPKWLLATFEESPVLEPDDAPAIPGLRIIEEPVEGEVYVIGADPAEGVQGGDDSALCVKHRDTGRSVAHVAGLFEPKAVFPDVIRQLSVYYNDAAVLCERNNHGHAVIGALEEMDVELLDGKDNKPGWQTTAVSKVDMYNTYARTLKDAYVEGVVLVQDRVVHTQLAAIDRKTLSHPEKKRRSGVDDEATAEVLAETARTCEERVFVGGWTSRR